MAPAREAECHAAQQQRAFAAERMLTALLPVPRLAEPYWMFIDFTSQALSLQ